MTLPFTPDMSVSPEVIPFFDAPTNTISYIICDPKSDVCAVIDSVMDIDYASGRITYDGADAMIAHIRAKGWTLAWLIETHVHADHLSAAPYIQGKLAASWEMARTSPSYRIPSEKFSTRAQNSSAMARSSTGFSPMVTAT